MKDSLIISGKTYISSKRAAEITRYSNDYIGQLCRGKKVDAQMMGRTWFVDQESLFEHKKNAEETLRIKAINQSHLTFVSVNEATPKIAPAIPEGLQSVAATHLYSSKPIQSYPLSAALPKVEASGFFGIPAKYFVIPAIVAVLFVGLIAYSSLVKNNAQLADGQTAGISDAIRSIGNFFSWSYRNILATLSGSNNNSVSENLPYSDYQSDVASSPSPLNGMAVVPSTGSNLNDEAYRQKVRETFSDEVNIQPDASGVSGIIKPVFKKATDNDFLYVLVPVKDADKNK